MAIIGDDAFGRFHNLLDSGFTSRNNWSPLLCEITADYCMNLQIIMKSNYRLGNQEGTISIMRARVEAAEKEKADLHRQLHQAFAHGAVSYQTAELQTHLDSVNKQLAFKDQEVADLD